MMNIFNRLKKNDTGVVDFPKTITKLIMYLLIANAIISAVIFFILSFANPVHLARFTGSIFFIVIISSLFIVLRRGHVRAVKMIAVILNFSLILLQIWLDGGTTSPNFYTLLIGIILATLAYGLPGMAITGCLSVAAGYIFSLLQASPRFYTAHEIMIIQLGTFITISLYVYFSISLFKNELSRNVQLNEKLTISETRLLGLIQHLPIGGMVMNYSGEISLVNNRLADLLGFGRDELKNIGDWFRLVYPDPQRAAESRQYFQEHAISAEKTTLYTEWEAFSRAGSRVDFEVFATMLGDDVVVLLNDITERKKAEVEITNKYSQLSSLRTLDIAIVNSERLSELLDVFVEQISSQLASDATWVILHDYSTGQLWDGFVRGFSKQCHIIDLPSNALIQNIFAQSGPTFFDDPDSIKRTFGDNAEGVSFCAAMPLTTKNGVVGLLAVFRNQPFSPDPDWLRFFEALAGQTAIGIDRINLIDNLKQLNESLVTAYDTTLHGWARALELRDKETEGHSRRVAEMTLKLARAIGIPEGDLKDIYRGALLHDIGKMPIPDSILLKNGPLSDDEWVLMRQHPETAYQLLKSIPFLKHAVEIPYGHHEHWDGSGYPLGQSGEQIPLAARVFAIADVWDALCSDRPYRDAWPEEKVMDYILERSGKQFDPMIVAAFEKMMKDV